MKSANDITVMVLEAALKSANPVSPAPVRNAILALGMGLVLGVHLALLMERRASSSD